MKRIAIIGSGFSGLSAACYLSKEGYQVDVFEKNSAIGGRARQLKTEHGYIFDMGPSWYWMPDVFERFFNDFGYSVSDFYTLKLLDPSFEIVFPDNQIMKVPSGYKNLCTLFESIEKGSAKKLEIFMHDAKFKYDIGMKKLVYKPGLSFLEFMDPDIIKGALRLDLFSSFGKMVRKYFTHPHLIALMEFPVLFLGAMPDETPALYSLMNYAGLNLGTWYPQGGFGKVVDAMSRLAENNGVRFHLNSTVEKIVVDKKKVKSLIVNGKENPFDAIIASADYHHIESDLLDSVYRNYDEAYWNKKTLAPSCLIYYIGLNKKISRIQHHTLFFEEDLEQHSKEIYKSPQWPSRPSFYVCCPSQTDESVAPVGHENLFLLMPIATDLEDTETQRDFYFWIMINRLEKHLCEKVSKYIVFKKSYCVNDFKLDYNSFKGNAYGLANTLKQTANLRPKIKNKKVNNLFYTGQLTVPGPGVPPSIISGKIAAQQVHKYFKNKKHETSIR
ncbi:MAG: phytoene desaturase family protein [Ginsengibacter sp.]